MKISFKALTCSKCPFLLKVVSNNDDSRDIHHGQTESSDHAKRHTQHLYTIDLRATDETYGGNNTSRDGGDAATISIRDGAGDGPCDERYTDEQGSHPRRFALALAEVVEQLDEQHAKRESAAVRDEVTEERAEHYSPAPAAIGRSNPAGGKGRGGGRRST